MNQTETGLDTVVVQTSGMVALDMNGETVMMSIANGKYYALNRVGSAIWALLSQPRTIAEVRDALLTEYAIPAEVCQVQVLEFIKRMERAGIVTLS